MTEKPATDFTLTDRMKLCCHWYALTGDPREAASRCFSHAPQRQQAECLLSSPAAEHYLAEISRCTPGKREPDVREGYRRIAFGSISDAIKLMFAPEEEQPEIDGLDLFNVSELRRGKGTLEISFIDRLDALDRLARQEEARAARDDLGFYEALRQGAAALGEEA